MKIACFFQRSDTVSSISQILFYFAEKTLIGAQVITNVVSVEYDPNTRKIFYLITLQYKTKILKTCFVHCKTCQYSINYSSHR